MFVYEKGRVLSGFFPQQQDIKSTYYVLNTVISCQWDFFFSGRDFLPLLHPLNVFFQLTEGYLNLLTRNWLAYTLHIYKIATSIQHVILVHTVHVFGIWNHK